jgi:hypothetical protein
MKCNFDRMNRMNRIEERQGSNGLAGDLSCKSCSSCLPFFSETSRPNQFPIRAIRTTVRRNNAIPRRFLPQRNARNSKRRAYDVSSLHCNPALQSGKVAQFREDPNTDDGRIFNAKSQRREGAKSFFLLGVSAPSRLCVKRPLLYPWNPGLPWFNTFWLRLAAL